EAVDPVAAAAGEEDPKEPLRRGLTSRRNLDRLLRAGIDLALRGTGQPLLQAPAGVGAADLAVGGYADDASAIDDQLLVGVEAVGGANAEDCRGSPSLARSSSKTL